MFGLELGIISTSIMENDKTTKQSDDENALEAPKEINALEGLSSTNGAQATQSQEVPTTEIPKKRSKFRRIWDVINIYLLIFILLVVVAGIVFIVSYLNSQQEPELPVTALQDLTQEQLSEIATGDANVGDPRYILNIQSDAVFAGSALVRGDLNIAGSLQLGEGLLLPDLTVSGASNLNTVQMNTLNIAGATTMQGALTLQDSLSVSEGLSVGGTSTFNGAITATSVTTGSLTLAGNGTLTVNNHIKVNGPTPSRTNGGSIGSGGSTSVSGSDTSGTVNINTGSGASAGCLVNVVFNQSFEGNPQINITPTNAAAATIQYYIQRSSTGFSICSANNPGGGRSFSYDYFAIN